MRLSEYRNQIDECIKREGDLELYLVRESSLPKTLSLVWHRLPSFGTIDAPVELHCNEKRISFLATPNAVRTVLGQARIEPTTPPREDFL